MTAINSQDLQAVSAVWGSKDGPARDLMPPDALYNRIITMRCYLVHDRYRILDDGRPKADTMFYRVEVSKSSNTAQTSVTTVPGPSRRWYVLSVELQPLQQYAARNDTTTARTGCRN